MDVGEAIAKIRTALVGVQESGQQVVAISALLEFCSREILGCASLSEAQKKAVRGVRLKPKDIQILVAGADRWLAYPRRGWSPRVVGGQRGEDSEVMERVIP
jgi:hypothetical protein